MLIKIAWRNIWRNKVRSLVVIISIALGILAGLFTMAVSVGMNNSRTRAAINTYISHIQIHSPEFKKEQRVNHTIIDYPDIEGILNAQNVEFSSRVVITGMASSANGVQGVFIQGIDPAQEQRVSDIKEKIVEGSYFENTRRNPVVIGSALADKLKLKLNSKLVLTFQDVNENITAAAFRINGIYDTYNSKFDESAIFVARDDLQNLLGLSANQVHEIALIAPNLEQVEIVQEDLLSYLPDQVVESWDEISPDLGYADEMMATSLYVFIGIILLAMAFGILNTMLMAVLERQRELGMLMAIGMNKVKVFGMVLYETFFLAIIAGPLGLLVAYFLNSYFQSVGIDLSLWGEGMESFGISSMVYPELEGDYYLTVAIMVMTMALLSAIYPALKAVKLKPTETMRTI